MNRYHVCRLFMYNNGTMSLLFDDFLFRLRGLELKTESSREESSCNRKMLRYSKRMSSCSKRMLR